MRLKSQVESILRHTPFLYRLGSRVYHRMNSEFRTLSPGAPAAIRNAFALHLTDRDAEAFLGDYYEFGVFRGGTFLATGQVLDDMGLDGVAMYGFDSFEGLPAPEDIDATDTRFFEGQFSCARQQVEQNLRDHGMDMSRATLIKGFYEDSLTEDLRGRHPFQPASVVLLDCDYYVSTKQALAWLDPYLRVGTILLFDDWFSYDDAADLGQQKAAAEWGDSHPQFRLQHLEDFKDNGRGFIIRAA